jgi:hypothetical protein
MSINCDTILAVSRPDARPVTWIGVLLAEDVTLALVLAELLEIEEVDIATLDIGRSGDRTYGV